MMSLNKSLLVMITSQIKYMVSYLQLFLPKGNTMSDKGQKIATAVMATLTAAATTMICTNALAAGPKCYGIAKAGKNACGSIAHEVDGVKVPAHACAGQATTSFSCYEWLPIPKPQCSNFVVTANSKNYAGFTSPHACLVARGKLQPACPKPSMEKCYGIAKTGPYMNVLKGNCTKIKGGSLTPSTTT
jgi:uncharacterized membrane protein